MFEWGVLFVPLCFAAAFFYGRRLAHARSGSHIRNLCANPFYHGFYLALTTTLWVTVFLVCYGQIVDIFRHDYVFSLLPGDVQALGYDHRSLVTSRIEDIASMVGAGIPPSADTKDWMHDGAVALHEFNAYLHGWKIVLSLGLYLIAFIVFSRLISQRFNARIRVERIVRVLLFFCACVAVAGTFGIVFSMLFEAIAFFKVVPLQDFLFGTVWDPRFQEAGDSGASGGNFGLLPLLWGTVYISFVAMLIAGPIGLMAAVFLSQYASKRWRAFAKPALEILAGIPTVVYGFFALAFVGPFLHIFGQTIGVEIGTTSVIVAGLVMGVMIIPYVSSLSEDILSAVPRTLAEGSAALGATGSETICKVLIPAALPGIVAAFVLAFSRAIGETMIVVMAAGIAARLSLNPFESLTTITVKIVSQLTGDLEFDTPQTQVAFALGLVLFVLTFVMNIFALRIVRKYRLRYE